MRAPVLAALALALVAAAARADDTRPPAISDVKASAKGGQVRVEARITDETGVLSAICHHRGPDGRVEDTPMAKNDFDDVFKATFAGGGDTEYWIESSDLLGNGPSMYGSSGKAFAVGGQPGTRSPGTAAATREPQQQKEPQQEKPPHQPRERRRGTGRTAKVEGPPVVEHRQPGAQPPEGRDFTVRMKIKSGSPVAVAILQTRAPGAAAFNNLPLSHTEGDSYEVVIPGAQARGSIEYFIAAKNQAGQMTRQGNGDAKTPYLLNFKPSSSSASASAGGSSGASAGGSSGASGSGGSAGSPSASAGTSDAASSAGGAQPEPAAGPYQFSHLPLYRVPPGRSIVLRAQIVPSAESGDLPDRAAVLWRGNDAQDQFIEMAADPTGGYGGFKAELPPLEEGGLYYQLVACDAAAARCGAETGSKHRWRSAAVSAQAGAAQPLPIDAVSAKAPPTLPE